MDRFLKCPVCCVNVPLSYLHEHYENHFRLDGAAIKVSPETEILVKTKSPTSTELQQETKMSKRVAATSPNMMTDTKVAKTEVMDEILKNEANTKRLS